MSRQEAKRTLGNQPKWSIGDKILTWVSDQPDCMSTIVAIRPYTGRYPEVFTSIVTVTAPRTNRGTIEMAV